MKILRLLLVPLVLLALTVPASAQSLLRDSDISTLQNAVAATGNGTAMTVTGYSTVGAELTISGSATVTWEGSVFATFVAIPCTNKTTGTSATTATASGSYTCDIAGLANFRARVSTFVSGTITANARATTASTANSGAIDRLLPCEDELNNLCMTSGGVVRGTEGNIINSAVGNATSAAFTLPTGNKSITARITGAGAVAQVITIYGGTSSGMVAATSNVICTITLSGTSGAAGTADMCPPFVAPALFYKAVTSGSSGTPTTILTASY